MAGVCVQEAPVLPPRKRARNKQKHWAGRVVKEMAAPNLTDDPNKVPRVELDHSKDPETSAPPCTRPWLPPCLSPRCLSSGSTLA